MKLHIDGTMPDDTLASGDGDSPFYVFDEDKQHNVAGPFSDKRHAAVFIQGATEFSKGFGRTFDDDQDLNEVYDRGRNYGEASQS